MAKKRKCAALTASKTKKFDDLKGEALAYLGEQKAATVSGCGFWEMMNDEKLQFFSALWSGVLGVISVLTFIVWLATRRTVDAYPGLVPLIFALLTVGVPSVAIGIACARKRHLLNKDRETRRRELDAAKPTQYIPSYLSTRLEDEKHALIGDGSEFDKVTSRAEALLRQTRTIKERFTHHCQSAEGGAPEFLREGLACSEALVVRAEATAGKLNNYRAKVEAFFAECQAEVNQLTVPLTHYELMAELAVLTGEAEALEEQAGAVIIETTARLAHRVLELQALIGRQFDAVGLQLALSAASSGDFDRDLAMMDELIGGFVGAAERIPVRRLGGPSCG
ncbi:MAG: hypothetical protein AAB731_00275 [Patescibacteria group bacterium]